MALSRVGYAAGDGTTITIPAGHQNGDVIIIYGFRAATTAPTAPAGWTLLATSTSGASSFRMSYKIAASGAETSGTWTNATGLICAVYRNPSTVKNPLPTGGTIAASGATATSATPLYSQASAISVSGGAWVIAFAAIKSTTSTIENPPTGLSLQVNTVGAAVEYAAFDSNGIYPSDTYLSNSTAGTASAEWRTYVTAIYPDGGFNNNYQFPDVGDGMSVGEKIK